jgi:hypothetical protein
MGVEFIDLDEERRIQDMLRSRAWKN